MKGIHSVNVFTRVPRPKSPRYFVQNMAHAERRATRALRVMAGTVWTKKSPPARVRRAAPLEAAPREEVVVAEEPEPDAEPEAEELLEPPGEVALAEEPEVVEVALAAPDLGVPGGLTSN